MGNVEVKINLEGLEELFKSEEIQKACIDTAHKVVKATGKEGYNVSEWCGPNRAGATIWCNAPSAIKDNLENNTLLKALGSVVPADKIVEK